MIRKLLDMFRHPADPAKLQEISRLDGELKEQRQLGRLAKSEFIDNLFGGVVQEIGRQEPPSHAPRP